MYGVQSQGFPPFTVTQGKENVNDFGQRRKEFPDTKKDGVLSKIPRKVKAFGKSDLQKAVLQKRPFHGSMKYSLNMLFINFLEEIMFMIWGFRSIFISGNIESASFIMYIVE